MYNVLTDNMQVVRLAHHRLSVDLTHVPSPVTRGHVPQSQGPGGVAMRHADAVILGDHVTGYRENRLSIHTEPCHL